MRKTRRILFHSHENLDKTTTEVLESLKRSTEHPEKINHEHESSSESLGEVTHESLPENATDSLSDTPPESLEGGAPGSLTENTSESLDDATSESLDDTTSESLGETTRESLEETSRKITGKSRREILGKTIIKNLGNSDDTSDDISEDNSDDDTIDDPEYNSFGFRNTISFAKSISNTDIADIADIDPFFKDKKRRVDRAAKVANTKKTTKEELTEYALRDYVGKSFVWNHLVTLPSIEFMQKIHKGFSESTSIQNKKKLQYLLELDHKFFNLLKLIHYYVVIEKNEDNLVKFTLHSSVSLLTEVISKLAINKSNHGERLYEIYIIMLKLEKDVLQLKDLDIKEDLILFLDNNFIVVDKVISIIYKNYILNIKTAIANLEAQIQQTEQLEQEVQTQQMEILNKYKTINNVLEDFFKKIKALKKSEDYLTHDFSHLYIEDNIDINSVQPNTLLTPEKQKTAGKTTVYHFTPPDKTPDRTNDKIKKSAKYIANTIEQIVLLKQKLNIPKTIKPKQSKQSKDDILEKAEKSQFATFFKY